MSSNTTNISNLRTSELLEFQIPFPPLTEQKRIASLLARADRLRQLRQTAHDLGDALLQSVFLEMFGYLKFPEVPLSEICNFITKGTTPQSADIKDQATDPSDVPFLKVYHIVDNGKIDFDYSPTFVSKSIHESLLNRSKAYPNDVLMNIVGPPLRKIGIVPASYPE
jgi:type I restriction enzyme, S subunit